MPSLVIHFPSLLKRLCDKLRNHFYQNGYINADIPEESAIFLARVYSRINVDTKEENRIMYDDKEILIINTSILENTYKNDTTDKQLLNYAKYIMEIKNNLVPDYNGPICFYSILDSPKYQRDSEETIPTKEALFLPEQFNLLPLFDIPRAVVNTQIYDFEFRGSSKGLYILFQGVKEID